MSNPDGPSKEPTFYARNFTISTEERMRAASGAPPFAVRLRQIEDLTRAITDAIAVLSNLVPPKKNQLDRGVLRERASRNLEALNRLIVDHNRYYPIEAMLRTDVRTHRYMDWGEPWEPMPAATWEALAAKAREEHAARAGKPQAPRGR